MIVFIIISVIFSFLHIHSYRDNIHQITINALCIVFNLTLIIAWYHKRCYKYIWWKRKSVLCKQCFEIV